MIGQVAADHPVKRVCDVLDVSRSGYYSHLKKDERPRRLRDEELKPLIRLAFERGRGVYGSPRIKLELDRSSTPCSRRRVARLMREDGLRAKTKGKWKPRTTQSDPKLATAPNWLGEVPHPSAINQVWVSDITYLQTDAGWHYLAAVMDLCSRRIVGWAIGNSLETTLVSKALERALALRGTTPGLIHHSDRGCQYASRYYRQSLADSAITASMSRKGNCYDNAAMESFWATLKTEGFNEKELKTRRETELMVFDYVEAFYNPRRLHTGIGGMSPIEFEMKQQQQQQQQEQQKQKHQNQNQQQKQKQKQNQQPQHTPLY